MVGFSVFGFQFSEIALKEQPEPEAEHPNLKSQTEN